MARGFEEGLCFFWKGRERDGLVVERKLLSWLIAYLVFSVEGNEIVGLLETSLVMFFNKPQEEKHVIQYKDARNT